jgi:hypothetical protein
MINKPKSAQDAVGLDGTRVSYTNLDYLQRVFTGALCRTISMSFIHRAHSSSVSSHSISLGAVVVKVQNGSVAGKENPVAGLPDPYVSVSVIEDQYPSSPDSATPSPVDCTYMFRTEKEGSAGRVMCTVDSGEKVICCT